MALHPGEQKRHLPEGASVKGDPIRRILGENDDWYRDLVEHSADLLCIHDLQGRLLAINPAPARVLGYSVEELLGIPMREVIVPEFRSQFDAYLSQVERTGESRGLMAVLTRSGQQRVWEYHNTLRTDGMTTPIVRGIAHDVTERVRAEMALREANEKLLKPTRDQDLTLSELSLFHTLMDQSNDAIEVVDPETLHFLDVNQRACVDLGYSREELLSMTVLDVDPNIGENVRAGMQQQLRESGSAIMESVHRRKDGTTFPVEVSMRAVQLDREYFVAVSRDITERKRADEAVATLVQQLGEAKQKLTEEKFYLEQEINTEMGVGELIGRSKGLQAVMQRVGAVAASDATVLLLGETGTGKELVARAIHRLSLRSERSFIKMNCAAIPSGLLESELFGNEKGAFTGAVSKKIGRLELADKGTLFLDEIGELSPHLQPKLLRVLQDQEFERLGGTKTLKVDFRLIAATNRDLAESMRQSEFRSDLYYRLSVFPIRLPPLRERREDIPLLAEHFVRKYARDMKKSITSIPARTLRALREWKWPGNVRELENFIERSVILTHGSVLVSPLSELQSIVREEEITNGTLEAAERAHILRALQESHGQIGGLKGAAARLGLNRTTLQSKLKQLGINPRSAAAGQ
jgi:PAS domain S-box-containing protein